ncbi:MAG: universal stress protein UspA [Planctomycetes bacterium]|nr:universal stress protein UspA [Planctomycetota bacterium]
MSNTEILVPVDFSDCSRVAAEHGLRLADQLGGSVTLLHALCGDPPTVAPIDYVAFPPETEVVEKANRELAEFTTSLESEGVDVAQVVVTGYPATAILDRIKANPPRMVVMGTLGRTGLARLVMGSQAVEVVRRSEVPVLVVRAPETASAKP